MLLYASEYQEAARLAQGADTLFIEAMFRKSDEALGATRHRRKARQVGFLARLARAKRLVTLHYSPRYKGRGRRLLEEVLEAFHGS